MYTLSGSNVRALINKSIVDLKIADGKFKNLNEKTSNIGEENQTKVLPCNNNNNNSNNNNNNNNIYSFLT